MQLLLQPPVSRRREGRDNTPCSLPTCTGDSLERDLYLLAGSAMCVILPGAYFRSGMCVVGFFSWRSWAVRTVFFTWRLTVWEEIHCFGGKGGKRRELEGRGLNLWSGAAKNIFETLFLTGVCLNSVICDSLKSIINFTFCSCCGNTNNILFTIQLVWPDTVEMKFIGQTLLYFYSFILTQN